MGSGDNDALPRTQEAPMPRVWAKGTATAHRSDHCGNQIDAKFSEVIYGAAPPTPTSSSSSVPHLTLCLGGQASSPPTTAGTTARTPQS
jgi:hypothetical protein